MTTTYTPAEIISIMQAERLEEIRQAEQSRVALAEAIAARLGELDAATLVRIAKLIG